MSYGSFFSNDDLIALIQGNQIVIKKKKKKKSTILIIGFSRIAINLNGEALSMGQIIYCRQIILINNFNQLIYYNMYKFTNVLILNFKIIRSN